MSNIQNDKHQPKYQSDRKLKMSTIFTLEVKGGKYYKVFKFLNDPFPVMGDTINMIFGGF